MRCPICNEKIPKKAEICPGCKFRLPPEPTFIQKLLFLPIPEILFALIIIAGICLLVYRLATPDTYQEPILNLSEQLNIDTNVGVVFFDNSENSYINEINASISKLSIDGDCQVKYKYNTDEDCYEDAVSSLILNDKCKDIIIAGDKYHDVLLSFADEYDDANFYVLWGAQDYSSTPPENVQICRTDISKAIYSIGVNSADHLTDMIKAMDVTDPAFSETNYIALFLYKNDSRYDLYEQYVAGIKTINPNLSTYAVKVEDEAEIIQGFEESSDVYSVMVADEMPIITDELYKLASDNIYLSGVSSDVERYSNYLYSISIDNNTFINHIFHSIANGTDLTAVYNGTYEDNFCRLNYNKSNIMN